MSALILENFMFFELDNPWLWVSAFLALIILVADVSGALAGGRTSVKITYAALPLHLTLIISMLVGGAELILAVTAMMVSLLVYTAAKCARIKYDKRQEGDK